MGNYCRCSIIIPFRSAIHLYLYYHVLLKVEDTDITEALAEYIGDNQLKIPLPPEPKINKGTCNDSSRRNTVFLQQLCIILIQESFISYQDMIIESSLIYTHHLL